MQEKQHLRVSKKKITLKEKVVNFLKKHSYTETILLLSIYLFVGFLIDSNDICLLNSDIPYLIILLAVVTLFHGFENGIIAISILAMVMFFTYDLFPYIDFLILLMLTLIFSQFNYYWTSKIKEAEVEADYKSVKLSELSRAFYSLKISHDQLEKNYVIKPMSIRNSLDSILSYHQKVMQDETIKDKQQASFQKFLKLLQKSFSVQSGLILYDTKFEDSFFEKENVKVITLEALTVDEDEDEDIFKPKKEKKATLEEIKEEVFDNVLVTKAINKKLPVFISDEAGDPSLKNSLNNKYIAAIPAIYEEKIIAMLVIEKMPFMAFERENLTSIAILLEYFSMEIRKSQRFHFHPLVNFIEDTEFKYEIARLTLLHEKFQVDSTFIILDFENELHSLKMKEKVSKMLRSLDMITYIAKDDTFYIILLFPLQDKAAAEGFLGRLQRSINEKEYGEFIETILNISRIDLLHDHIMKNSQKVSEAHGE